jgi:hypothetical protein
VICDFYLWLKLQAKANFDENVSTENGKNDF